MCLKWNHLRYTNLLDMGITGLIQELLETCIYCLCVIGTICWHEVITCGHHVSINQKCLFNSLTFLDKSCMAEFSTLGFISAYFLHDLTCECSFFNHFVFTLLCFAGGQSAKVETSYLLGLVNNILWFIILYVQYIHCKMPSQIQSAHTPTPTHSLVCAPHI